MKKFTQIYLVTNCFGDLNKVYIGKEKSNQKLGRKYYHKRTYGDLIEFDFIDQVDGWSKKDWKPLETFWIRYFKFLGFEILNGNEGGGGPSFQTEEAKQKIGKSLKGFNHTEEAKQKMRKPKPKGFGEMVSKRNKGVPKPKGFGEKISKAKKNHPIYNNEERSKKISKSKKGHICYKNPERNKKISESHNKSIIQEDLNGNFIKEYSSQIEAAKNIGVLNTTLWKHMSGITKTCKGFIFKFK